MKEAIKDGIVILWYIILLIILIGVISSCSTSRKVEMSSYGKTDSTAVSHKVDSVVVQGTSAHIDTTWMHRKGEITIYDTSLPVDTATGMHPVRVVIRIDEETKTGITETIDTLSRHVIAEGDTTEVHSEQQADCKRESKNSGKWSWQIYALLLAASFMAGAIIVTRTDIISRFRKWLTRITC